jgi:translocation and assembly module TamB
MAMTRRRRWIVGTLAGIAVLVLLVVGGAAWVLTTPQGARLVLGRVQSMLGEGVRLEGVEGRLGGLLRIATIELSRPDMYVLVRDFEIDTSPVEPLRGRLHIFRLGAKSVEVRTASTEAAAKIPVTFEPPYALRIDEGRVGELRLGTLSKEAQAERDPAKRRAMFALAHDKDFLVRDIFLRGEGDKRHWNVAEARAETTYGKASLVGTLDTTPPFALAATLRAAGRVAERDYDASATLAGKLTDIEARAEGSFAGQRATLGALLQPFAKVPVRTLSAQARDVDLANFATGVPHTRLGLDARLAAEGASTYAGPVKVDNALPGTWDLERLPFTTANARVAVGAERIDVTDLAVMLLGGGNARGHVAIVKGVVEADLRVADVDLAALHRELQKTRVAGRIGVKATSGAQGFEVALKDPRFAIEGRAALANDRLEVETARVQTGGGAIVAKGGMALKGRREFRFEGRAEHFDPAAFVKTPRGDLNFTFATSGTLADAIAGEARLEIAPSRFAGQSASGRLVVAGDRNRIANADVQLAIGEARIDAKGSFGRAGDALEVKLHAPDLAVLSRPFGLVLAGRLDGEGRLTGTFRSPAGRVSLTGANLLLPGEVRVKELALQAQAGADPDSAIDATVRATGLTTGAEPAALAQSLQATLKGTRAAHRLEAGAQLTREEAVQLVLQGGLDARSARPAWNGRIESLAFSGRGAFALAQPAPLALSAEKVELGDATLKGDWGEARLALTRWTPRTLDLKGGTAGIRIQDLARSLRVSNVPRASLVVAGEWDIHAAETFDGTLRVRRVSGDMRVGEPPLALGLKELELRMEAARGRAKASLDIQGDRIGRIQGEGTGLLVRDGAGWTFAKDAPVAAKIAADVPDLAAIAPWLGPEAKAGGHLVANIVVSGTGANPRFAGDVRAQDLALREPQTGFELEQGQVALRLDGKALTIEQFVAVTPWHPSEAARTKLAGVTMPAAGRITADGGVDLAAHTGTIRIVASQVPATQLQTRFLAMSGEAKLQATEQGILATGDFKADAGWIGAPETPPPSVSDDVVVIRAARTGADESLAKPKQSLRIDAHFALGEQVYFEGRGLDTRLTGELRIAGDPTSGLRATGSIRTLGGTYKGYGQRLAIERGVLQFAGPVDNPQLNVLALRKGLPVEAGVEVLGSVARPRVRLVSSPDVPEPEKLSWLVLGRGPSELGPGDASVLVAAAASMFGKGDSSDFGKKLGFDEVKIGRSDANSVLGVLPQSTVAGRTGTASASEVVSVGKRLGRNLQLTYEQGLADAEGALKITYTISQKFQVLARAGFLPGLDAVYRWTFP